METLIARAHVTDEPISNREGLLLAALAFAGDGRATARGLVIDYLKELSGDGCSEDEKAMAERLPA